MAKLAAYRLRRLRAINPNYDQDYADGKYAPLTDAQLAEVIAWENKQYDFEDSSEPAAIAPPSNVDSDNKPNEESGWVLTDGRIVKELQPGDVIQGEAAPLGYEWIVVGRPKWLDKWDEDTALETDQATLPCSPVSPLVQEKT